MREWGKTPDNAGYIHNLAVIGGYRGKGVGLMMIDYLADIVVCEGRSYLRLDCDAGNTDLCRYYERLGFEKVGEHKRPDAEMGLYRAPLYQRHVEDE